jgi:hypothetical protein
MSQLEQKESLMSEGKSLNHDPLSETEQILSKDFYGQTLTSTEKSVAHGPKQPKKSKSKPTHYKVVCISLYTKDIEYLNTTVKELKRRGYTKANKSQLIRMALDQLDIDKLPPPGP